MLQSLSTKNGRNIRSNAWWASGSVEQLPHSHNPKSSNAVYPDITLVGQSACSPSSIIHLMPSRLGDSKPRRITCSISRNLFQQWLEIMVEFHASSPNPPPTFFHLRAC